ncbi:hypothetical protein EVAR_23683_1 [Eumeta japonica]|uniref:Uncharacterized protein n=1 Tax=Eumeta variegata TaxID=151549 RepID=A0A4C1VJK9_EUMVA|nr:hypothetical protein EVAR_23683_1 [Eumeta japonica]
MATALAIKKAWPAACGARAATRRGARDGRICRGPEAEGNSFGRNRFPARRVRHGGASGTQPEAATVPRYHLLLRGRDQFGLNLYLDVT